MKKTEAIQIITRCAKEYRSGLSNQNILFLFGAETQAEYFETTFLPRHFLHLTGVVPAEGRVRSSKDFYEKCCKGKLSPEDFSFADNGTTEMKLSVLPQLMQIDRKARMVGDYDFAKSVLRTEKLAGGVRACMGFVRDTGAHPFYVPNTALREDIRDVTVSPQKRILAIFRKGIREPCYTQCCYLAKGVAWAEISLPAELVGRLSP
jgi:hypothetical protein